MKKALLIGELNQTVSNLNDYMLDQYHTQICADNLELVKGMTKVSKPHIVIICLFGLENLDVHILDYFRKEYPHVPVLLVGTAEECKGYKAYYEEEQFDFILRPTTQTALLQRCAEKLQIGDFTPVEEVVSVPSPGEKKLILLVDDSALSLRNIKALLDSKYEVIVAKSGEKAVQLAKKQHPALILLDYEMPGWDGKRTLEEIRSQEDIMDIPVVFLTGVSDSDDVKAVLGFNPSGYLLKPLEQKRLFSKIEEILGVW